MMFKRWFDILVSLIALLLLFPLFFIIAILIRLNSKGGIFYRQVRVGRNGKDFYLYKFRTMHTGADKKGLLTIGARDNRVTGIGYYLRRYKLDELPQLLNVLYGNMSLVGPRPEVRKYVDLYNEEQLQVLSVKPGITDYASIRYVNENELLGSADDPEKLYREQIMPHKLQMNLEYIREQGFLTDIKILAQTLLRILN